MIISNFKDGGGKMSTQSVYYCEALKAAIEFEQRSEKFYRDSIHKVKDEFAQKTLQLLADEEHHHIERINKANEALTKESGDFDLDAHCQTDLPRRIEKHLKEPLSKKADKIRPQISDIEIYDLAIDMEKAGYGVYKEHYQQSENKKTRKLLEFLIKEESVHYELLASTKKYLEDPSYYFEDYGGWIFGGV